MFIQCQTVGPENIHTRNILQTEQVIYRIMFVYTQMHVTTINLKRNHELKESKRCQLCGPGLSSLLCELQGLNSGCQAYEARTFTTEPFFFLPQASLLKIKFCGHVIVLSSVPLLNNAIFVLIPQHFVYELILRL